VPWEQIDIHASNLSEDFKVHFVADSLVWKCSKR